MKLGTFTKQPRERRSYSTTYEDALDPGDNIKSAELLGVTPVGLIVEAIVADPRVKFFVEGGTSGTTYTIAYLAKSEDGQTFEDEFGVKVKEIA